MGGASRPIVPVPAGSQANSRAKTRCRGVLGFPAPSVGVHKGNDKATTEWSAVSTAKDDSGESPRAEAPEAAAYNQVRCERHGH